MTMKMIRRTSRMSINGTTFISAMAPPLLSPTCIPIDLLLSGLFLASVTDRQAAPCGNQRGLDTERKQTANDWYNSGSAADGHSTISNRLVAEAVVEHFSRSARSRAPLDPRQQSGFRLLRQQRHRIWRERRSSHRRSCPAG